MEEASKISVTQRAVPPSESAWAAGLAPEEVVIRLADPIARCKDFPVDYTSDFEILSLLAFDDAVNQQKYTNLSERALNDRRKLPCSIHSYFLEVYCGLTFDVFQRTQNRDYAKNFLDESRKYLAEVPRAFDGAVSHFYVTFEPGSWTVHIDENTYPIVIDHMQEYASRMAKSGWLSGEQEFFDEASKQFEIYRMALRDPGTGLWANVRGWFDDTQKVSPTKWGRGHAWLLRGLVDTLTYLPPNSNEAHRLGMYLREVAEALLKYQDEMGFWHQVVDRKDSYQETSATGMIAYYIARAIRQNLLPATDYHDAAVKAINGVMKHKVSRIGVVYGACKSQIPQPSDEGYLNWDTPVNDPHGVAGVVLSAAAKPLLEGRSFVLPQAAEQRRV